MQGIPEMLMDWIGQPPGSAILIILVSVGVTLISNLATKRFSDVRMLRRYQTEIKEYQQMLKKAEKSQNEKALRKVKRRKAYIDRIQKEMMTARCKPTLLFIIPFMLIFYSLSGFFVDTSSGASVPRVVAIIPFSVDKLLPFLDGFIGTSTVDGGFGLYFFGFYALVGLGLGQIIQRMQGVNISPT
jgi:uncharacterized membrane protein (DUF106 family)